MRGEIVHQYGKCTDQEIADLKDKDDLVARVQAKYQLERSKAQRDVDAFAKGRQLVMRICQVVALGNCRGRQTDLRWAPAPHSFVLFSVHRDSIGGHRDACYVDFLL